MMTQGKEQEIVYNRKARFSYELLDTYNAGIKLTGLEVKALRAKLVSISEAWVKIDNQNQVWLVNASINPAKVPNWLKYSPNQDRLLLLRKPEIKKLKSSLLKGLTLVPIRIFFNERNFAKICIAVAKGKKVFDKRQKIKDRDSKRRGD